MSEDITVKLQDFLSWENAHEAVSEIQILRKIANDWKQTAKILAMDLGHVEYAEEIFEDIASGLYDKVRGRMIEAKENNA